MTTLNRRNQKKDNAIDYNIYRFKVNSCHSPSLSFLFVVVPSASPLPRSYWICIWPARIPIKRKSGLIRALCPYQRSKPFRFESVLKDNRMILFATVLYWLEIDLSYIMKLKCWFKDDQTGDFQSSSRKPNVQPLGQK